MRRGSSALTRVRTTKSVSRKSDPSRLAGCPRNPQDPVEKNMKRIRLHMKFDNPWLAGSEKREPRVKMMIFSSGFFFFFVFFFVLVGARPLLTSFRPSFLDPFPKRGWWEKLVRKGAGGEVDG